MIFPSKQTDSKTSIDSDQGSSSEKLVHAASRQQIRQWMEICRQGTLNLLAGIDHDLLCHQAHPDFSPIGWHLGHIGYTEALWILEHLAGQNPQFPEYRRLFAADTLPKRDRIHLPTFAEICDYLQHIRQPVFDYLETAPIDQQERLWRWLLQHESQHCETIAIVLALSKLPHTAPLQFAASSQSQTVSSSAALSHFPLSMPQSLNDMVQIPAGWFEMGNQSVDALDNERPAHQVYLDTYWLDRFPVTCEQYRLFMRAEGYYQQRWWSAEGWQWLQANQITEPLYWNDAAEYANHPVCGISWYEAEAYANFVGKRLPTEAEWEKAAAWELSDQRSLVFPWGEELPNPRYCNHDFQVNGTTQVDTYPAGVSLYGCYDLLGNVWEWTASWFEAYPNFESYPYRGYSEVYFDQQHRVLRGGSWATRPWALRSPFRNWYYPHMREMFVGFRCARNAS